MTLNPIFSSPEELAAIAKMLKLYLGLPVATDAIPGGFVENVIARARGGVVLRTYDFVDVLRRDLHVGWQIKSTKDLTPVTWKRAKIENSDRLIVASETSADARQTLGDEIINFCNRHAIRSMEYYNLTAIGYARLIYHANGSLTYFERQLCDIENPRIFEPDDFEWKWTTQKTTTKKEQLPAFHGRHRKTGDKWFAWHGRGENQLHFSGEGKWWPNTGSEHMIRFDRPSEDECIEFAELTTFLASRVPK